MYSKKLIYILVILSFLLFQGKSLVFATDYSSSSFTVKDPVITTGSQSSSSTNFGLNQSLSQAAPGTGASTGFEVWSGFQYYFTAQSNTLTATPGNAQVSLSWTVPTTYLGVSISGYEVGTGTISGSYTYENVGLVTSFIKTGLSNGTTYYFKIKAKTAGGLFLVFSNEATAVPTGDSTPPGGGGGGEIQTVLVYGYPNAQVIVLTNASVSQELTTDASGQIQVQFSSQGITSVYGRDQNSLTSPPVLLGGKTSVTLPPTVRLADNQSSLTVSGTAQKLVTLNLNISGPNQYSVSQAVSTSTQGQYSYSISTKDLPNGNYQLFLTGPAGARSKTLHFVVNRGKVELPEVVGCGDYNKDGRVNLIDFSILIYWYGKDSPPKHIDCNNDQVINLIDFSILMYNWTG